VNAQGLHVMVDALSSYSGGARTYMRAMLPRLGKMPGVRLTVLCREDQREGFGLLTPSLGVNWLPVPSRVKPLAARLAFSMGAVPCGQQRHRVDVLFCPTDHSPPVASCPTVLMIRNPTPTWRTCAPWSPGRGRRGKAPCAR